MNTDIESRLREALAARAEAVMPENLSPAVLSVAHDSTPWWRTPGSYLFLAAVAVIVLAIPILAMGIAGQAPDSRVPLTSDPTAEPSSTGDAGGVESDRLRGDVDGDGTADVVRVVSGGEGAAAETRVQALLTEHGAQEWLVPAGEAATLAGLTDLDGVAGLEVLVNVGSAPERLHVLAAGAARGGVLMLLLDGDAARGVDADGVSHHWWLEDGRLRSTLSLAPVPANAGAYEVQALGWQSGDEHLEALPLGTWCVRATEREQLVSCEDLRARTGTSPSPEEPTSSPSGSPTESQSDEVPQAGIGPRPDGWPEILPRYDGWVDPGTAVTLSLGSDSLTAVLRRRDGRWRLDVHRCADVETCHAIASHPLWEGVTDPLLASDPVSMGDRMGFVVRTHQKMFTLVPWTGAGLGSQSDHGGGAGSLDEPTWAAADLGMYTAVVAEHPTRPDLEIWYVSRWAYRADGAYTIHDLGEVCVGRDATGSTRWGRCTDPETQPDSSAD